MSDMQTEQTWASTNFSDIESGLNGHGSAPIHTVRREAFARFKELGIPTPQIEEWKYTNIAQHLTVPFRLAKPFSGTLTNAVSFGECHTIAVVNGFYAEKHSSAEMPKGVTFSSMADLMHGKGALGDIFQNYLGKAVQFQNKAFAALNMALLRDGIVIRIAKGATIEKPLHLMFVTEPGAEAVTTSPRALIVAEDNSSCRIIESYSGPDGVRYLSNAVTEIFLGENAQLDHYKLQVEGNDAVHVASVEAHQARSSNFRTHLFSLGSRLTRNDAGVLLDGEGIESTINGLSVLKDEQHVDNHTTLDHAKPHCMSHELFKGIYGDKSAGVFNGTIIVRPQAQKTNAIQSNQSLLLSRDATIDAKPQLKIWADDVKCTHGATIGQLDEHALFYIRSRGVSEQDARNMLIHAFASDVTKEVRLDFLRDYLEELLMKRLPS
jgi:Fe-S cluster assembly protein SufD